MNFGDSSSRFNSTLPPGFTLVRRKLFLRRSSSRIDVLFGIAEGDKRNFRTVILPLCFLIFALQRNPDSYTSTNLGAGAEIKKTILGVPITYYNTWGIKLHQKAHYTFNATCGLNYYKKATWQCTYILIKTSYKYYDKTSASTDFAHRKCVKTSCNIL